MEDRMVVGRQLKSSIFSSALWLSFRKSPQCWLGRMGNLSIKSLLQSYGYRIGLAACVMGVCGCVPLELKRKTAFGDEPPPLASLVPIGDGLTGSVPWEAFGLHQNITDCIAIRFGGGSDGGSGATFGPICAFSPEQNNTPLSIIFVTRDGPQGPFPRFVAGSTRSGTDIAAIIGKGGESSSLHALQSGFFVGFTQADPDVVSYRSGNATRSCTLLRENRVVSNGCG